MRVLEGQRCLQGLGRAAASRSGRPSLQGHRALIVGITRPPLAGLAGRRITCSAGDAREAPALPSAPQEVVSYMCTMPSRSP